MPIVSLQRCEEYQFEKVYGAVKKAFAGLGDPTRLLGPKGGRVLIKPNMMAAHPPDAHVCTHPEVVRAVIRLVKEHGSHPLVGDSPAGLIGKWDIDNVWKETSMERIVEEEGAEKVVFERCKITKIKTPYLEKLDEHLITSLAYECDAVINVPKFKTHTYMTMSGAVKNLYGMIPGKWKGEIHCRAPKPEDFGKIVASLAHLIKPKLTIMDAICGLEGDGPGAAGLVRNFGCVFATDDPVALDSVLAYMIGVRWDDIPVLKAAGDNCWGTVDIDQIDLVGVSKDELIIEDYLFPKKVQIRNLERFTRMVYAPTRVYPKVLEEKCKLCLRCLKSCPVKAMQLKANGGNRKQVVVEGDKCIECCCCYEVCDVNAIDLYGGKEAAV
ncbi:DUF362 domain-containing protein [Geotalea uraniireducens]|uniref:4Fe-4S ferredoxin-type domain-containing protein n=1 Tax=Geotalea uraniireducens (strain Rf4) TaxID=351605 RepID=A5G4H9_GEOUR|nr:DUF362 domain-containing protein [Geotalea uraniireducens]ABQ26697.1 protein of unknown function DUF362 [Geotalea uraniireducens Rf4]